MLWRGSDKHQFVIDHFDVILDLKRAFEEMPQTKLTVTKDDLRRNYDVNIKDHVPVDAFWILDSWPLSKYVMQTDRMRYVNPHNPDKWGMSCVFVRCDCGAFIKSGEFNTGKDEPHTEDCRSYWRHDCHAELARRRAATLKSLCRLYKPANRYYKLLGWNSDFNSNVIWQLNIDRQAEKEVGRCLMANTAVELLTDYSPEAIGEVYDVSRTSIYRAIEKYTDADIDKLEKVRRYG